MPKPQQESAQRGKGVESCPVFHPSEAEFKNFGEYIMSIEQQVLQYGACRIVPPAGQPSCFQFSRSFDYCDVLLLHQCRSAIPVHCICLLHFRGI